jgi:hypothetical protein
MGSENAPAAICECFANFVFARHVERDAATLADTLKQKRIFVRHFMLPQFEPFLRISIGTDAECDSLRCALRLILEDWHALWLSRPPTCDRRDCGSSRAQWGAKMPDAELFWHSNHGLDRSAMVDVDVDQNA